MNKDEAIALGVPEDKLKDFRELYHRDVRKTAEREAARNDPEATTREAIAAMLKLIRRADTLDQILRYINKAYFNEVNT